MSALTVECISSPTSLHTFNFVWALSLLFWSCNVTDRHSAERVSFMCFYFSFLYISFLFRCFFFLHFIITYDTKAHTERSTRTLKHTQTKHKFEFLPTQNRIFALGNRVLFGERARSSSRLLFLFLKRKLFRCISIYIKSVAS